MKKLNLILIAAVLTMNCFAQKTVELRYNLQKGQTYTQEMDMKMNVKMEVQGMKIDTDVPFFAKISYKVLAAENKNFTLETAYDVMRMKMNVMGQDIGFDSENPNDNSPLAMLAGMVGKKFTMTLDELGNVVNIEGLDKLFESMFEGKNFTEEQLNQMKATVSSIFSEEKIKENFSSGSIIFPKEAVKKGFEWTTVTTQQVQGINMVTNNSFVVDKLSGTQAFINSVSSYTLDGGITENDQNTKFALENSKMSATYIVDLKTGWTVETKSNMWLLMKITVNQAGVEMTMPMEISADIVVKSK
ncbi:MAG: DUF6263 family protein [Prevotellaceae bacterium]|jgi:hypothetical protein|nr:DUF6263 family protein [Prevotellaceae bacterium]